MQSIGSAVVEVTPGDYFELIAHQTSGSTKNVAADEFTWFAIEVVSKRRYQPVPEPAPPPRAIREAPGGTRWGAVESARF
jgi:hypothetical protein